ncbi:TRAP transporter fused permease subunit [Paracoccus sp. SCSIO 75233]|uniref:TRAP transporter permease n=1 Tax=Paracoccus sp. SCSIO 75233 TaxID=3017782 RepID=UPI0022F0A855|nr:TRAP transporter fused permease subunit [Paracoccus sp. SCSIO 75233]WBU51900.1 TRAP transporter fused permease subunit [Paracoccus sp. SCSIO 75233]
MRKISGPLGLAIKAWAAAATALHLYFAVRGWPEPLTLRSLHFLLFLPLIFLLFPARSIKQSESEILPADEAQTDAPNQKPSTMDWILAGLSLLPSLYMYLNANTIYQRSEFLTPLTDVQRYLGILVILLVLEGVRRALTPILAGLTILVITYMFTAQFLPGLWHYRAMSLDHVVETMTLINGRGIYGPLMGISATIVAIFITFGAFVRISGAGMLFSNIGEAAAGKYSGGPAKVAVISSCLFGTMSGSAVSNVASTGVVTIPLMKRLGYRPAFAGGVETAASVGGAIMPPVMGAASFLMAEITGIPYRTIIIAASLGAVLYYATTLLMVHLEARRLKLSGMPADQLPKWKDVFRDIHLLAPLVLLFAMLMSGFSPTFSAICAIGAVVVVSWLRRRTAVGPKQIFFALAEAGELISIVALAVAAAGMIVAGLTTTGLVIAISNIINSAAGGQLWLAAIMVALVSLLLGMGVPTTPAYLIVSVVGAPILIELGAPMLGAHLFVFYFAILADATPPVSIAAYTAAVIAKASPMQTGFEAWKLSIGGLVVAFSFVFTPAIMWQASVSEALMIFGVNVAAITCISLASIGYWTRRVTILPRALALATGIALAFSYGAALEYRALAAAAILLVMGLSVVLPQAQSERREN